MTNDLIPGIGHNQPPLSLDEQIEIDLNPLRVRSVKLLTSYAASRITDYESAADVLTLSVQLTELVKDTKEAQKSREEPYKVDLRTIQTAFTAVVRPVDEAERACRAMMQTWDDQRKAEAAVAQAKAAEEARAALAAARAAEKRANDALSGKNQLAAIKAKEEAEAALARLHAAEMPLQRIQSHIATLGSTRTPDYEITDTRKALAWALKHNQHVIVDALRSVIRGALRVNQVADPTWPGIPGVRAWIKDKQVRR